MADILGLQVDTPTIDISGFLADSWIYVFIIAVIGFILIAGVGILLFMNTYKRKIILFENVSGLGYQPTLKSKARVIPLGMSGGEVLKTLKGGKFVTAYGKKMGKNTYWFAKGPDGYWYNIVLGDLDTKMAILDIEPVDRDVRMFHVSLDRVAQNSYGEKKGFLEKYGVPIVFLIMVIAMMIGFYLTAGQIKEGMIASSNPELAEKNQETAEILKQLSSRLDTITRAMKGDFSEDTGSGLVPSTNITTGGG